MSLASPAILVCSALQLHLRDAVVGPTQLKNPQAEHRALLDAVINGGAEATGAAFDELVAIGGIAAASPGG